MPYDWGMKQWDTISKNESRFRSNSLLRGSDFAELPDEIHVVPTAFASIARAPLPVLRVQLT